jgi:hypothetical protein
MNLAGVDFIGTPRRRALRDHFPMVEVAAGDSSSERHSGSYVAGPVSDARTASPAGECGSFPRIATSLVLSSRIGTCQR